MLMQFCKGAGCAELTGMRYKDKRSSYTLYRPLLHLDKQELLSYLHTNKLRYFEDASNQDEKYTRNKFRKNHTNPLLQEYLSGIKKSFAYLDADADELIQNSQVHTFNQLAYFKASNSKRSDIYTIDKYLKSVGHMITANERLFLKEKKSLVVGRKHLITQMQGYIFIAPYIQGETMPKKLKEKMRLLHIEPKLRPYLALDKEALAFVSRLLQ
jgi:tRNA(Ile)-lysidine synthase